MTLVQFFKARKETPIMLDFVEKTFDQMPFFVDVFVILSLLLAIPAGRNHRLGFIFSDFLQEIRRIIRTVSNHTFKIIAVYQIFSLSNVMPLAARQEKPQWVAQGIYIGMDFGAESSPAASERLLGLTAFFWGAPAAQGWARTTVLSSSKFSISGSSTKC